MHCLAVRQFVYNFPGLVSSSTDLLIASSCFSRLSLSCLIPYKSALISFNLYSLPSVSLKVGSNCHLRIDSRCSGNSWRDGWIWCQWHISASAFCSFVLASIHNFQASSATAAKFTSHQRSCGCKCTLNGNWQREAGREYLIDSLIGSLLFHQHFFPSFKALMK